MRIAIEPMIEEDIPQVMLIEEQSFPTAWPANAYRREIRENRLARYVVAIDSNWRAPDGQTVIPPSPAPLLAPAPGWQAALARIWRRLVHPSEHDPPLGLKDPARRRIVGYAGVWLMVDEAHLTTIAVHPEYRRKGVGELLLVSSFDLAMELNAEVMTLEVRVSNAPAQTLYEKYGFARVGLRKGYYVDSHEDALIMTTENLGTPFFRQRFHELKRANRERLGRQGL